MKTTDITSILNTNELRMVLEFGELTEYQFKSKSQNLIGVLLKDGYNFNEIILCQINNNGYGILNMHKGFSIINDGIENISHQFRWYTEGLGKERLFKFKNRKKGMDSEMNKKDQRLLSIIKSAKAEYTDDNLVVIIPNIFSKGFTTFCSIREDLLMMKQYTLKLPLEKDDVIKSALMYSIISLYGKCFTDASKSKFPKLETDVFNGKPAFKKTHDDIMELRHRFIAHRGDTESEVTAAFMLIPKEDSSGVEIKFKRLKQISFQSDKLKEIRELIDFLVKKLDFKIEKGAKKAKKGMLENFTPEQLAFMNLNNTKE